MLHTAGTWSAGMLIARRSDYARQQGLARELAAQTLRVLGVRVRVRGAVPQGTPVLVVANHVSWLDVYALNCLLRARFVAKREVRDWPLAGSMVAAFGALFIKRGCPRDAARVRDQITAGLRRGERIVVFPEGTTSDGTTLHRFYPALFQSAVDAGAMVQSVAIRYLDDHGEPIDAAAFVDDMTFGASLLRIAAAPRITAELHFAPPRSAVGRTRRELASESQNWIAAQLALPSAPALPQAPWRRFDRAA